jgi:hypothetical protein
MHITQDIMTRLRGQVGRRLQLGGRPWRIVEVLASDGHLVLESVDAEPPILPDQYGNAAMRGQEHLELALLTPSGELTADARRLLDALDATLPLTAER